MHTLRLFSAVFVGLLLSFSTLAGGLKDQSKVDKVSDYFMSQIAAGEVKDAYAIMATYLGVDATAFEARAQQVTQNMTQLNSSIGKPLSYALIKTQEVDEHFYKLTYLLKYPSAALVWELNYYQPDQGWVLVDIAYHTKIDSLFD